MISGRNVVKEKITILEDDITTFKTDAIFCQANTELEIMDTISKELMDRGGEAIQNECNQIENLVKGQAVITSGGNLDAKYLLHLVGYDSREEGINGEDEDLMNSTRNALNIVKEKQLKSLSIPLLGSENTKVPIKRAAELILAEVKKHLEGETSIEEVFFIASNHNEYDAFDEAYRQL